MFPKNNSVQFAVVREDPEIETALLKMSPQATHTLLIGSGGCTALTLRSRFPELQLSLMEPNPSQIELIRTKQKSLFSHHHLRSFSIGQEDLSSLNSCGNFESLFRSFRNFLYEFVMERETWFSLFQETTPPDPILESIFSSKYWPVAFELFFSDPLLRAMFGPEAIQHAPQGSYPIHFRNVLEAGLKKPGMKNNYFLHHIFLGHYINSKECLPPYLTEKPHESALQFEFLPFLVQQTPHFGNYDLISLSNIFDWMQEDQVSQVAQRLTQEMKPGSWILFRQLNNGKNFQNFFGKEIKFDQDLASQLFEKDRSLFYTSLAIGRKLS